MAHRNASIKTNGWGEVATASLTGGGERLNGKHDASHDLNGTSSSGARRGSAGSKGPILRPPTHDKKDSNDLSSEHTNILSSHTTLTPSKVANGQANASLRHPSNPPLPTSRLPFVSSPSSTSISNGLPSPYSTRLPSRDDGPRLYGHKLSSSITKPLNSLSETLSGSSLANALPGSSASLLATVKCVLPTALLRSPRTRQRLAHSSC